LCGIANILYRAYITQINATADTSVVVAQIKGRTAFRAYSLLGIIQVAVIAFLDDTAGTCFVSGEVVCGNTFGALSFVSHVG
jgi:hypothetical protein